MPLIARGADSPTSRPAIHINHAGLSKLGWQLACVGSTFQDRSLPDMIDLLHSINVHHIELSAGQIDPTDVAATTALLAKLKTVHMDIVSIGIIDLGQTEADARPIFELGKRLKIKIIVADPSDDSLEMLDKLANEYHINVAIKNFVIPGRHWEPAALLPLLTNRSARVGVCVDVDALRDSRVSPVDAVKQLAGHILEVRPGNFDAPDTGDVLAELKQQKFKGIFAIECPPKPADDLLDRFAHSINAFSKIVGDLSGLQ
jgi:sugar phosphate isomerase/epimerase